MADHKEERTSCLNIHQEQSSYPHEALFFVLAYLPLFELLAMTRVCKSLRDAISRDILPWLNITVERPLSLRLTDEILMQLIASKSKGRLRLLALNNCVKITDTGLLSIVAHNPHINKLHVPGCTKLTPAGVIRAVELLTKHNHRLKSLQISGIHSIQKEDLEILHALIINPNQAQQKQRKIFYHKHKKLWTLKDEEETAHPIDVDVCPKCDQVRMVFDCPQVLCNCSRGCIFCVPRCIECGICVKATEEIEEALCADSLCLQCWLKLPKCSFCNKPYCKEHANLWHKQHSSSALVCANCHCKFM